MALFPTGNPLPSQISAPAIIDPMWSMDVDQGYQVRRSKHSRPRRRFVIDWLGRLTEDMHIIRDFLYELRLGVHTCEFLHSTSFDTAQAANTTPIILTYPKAHGYRTGQYLWVTGIGALPTTIWQLTRLSQTQVALNGSTALGATPCFTNVYLPYAVVIAQSDTWESPQKLIGPEAIGQGAFNFSITLEEVF
jgi:hypothetical protein